MTTDNRTNEPSEAQVEAAAKIIRRASLETTADPGDFWSDCYEGEREAWRNAARAALVAAAGAAPQAECTETPGGRPCEASKPGHKLHYANGAIDKARAEAWDEGFCSMRGENPYREETE